MEKKNLPDNQKRPMDWDNDFIEEYVDIVFDTTLDNLEQWNKSDKDGETALDILAGWGKIRRFKPEWVQRTEYQQAMTRIRETIHSEANALCEAAFSILSPEDWLDNAQYQTDVFLNGEFLHIDHAAEVFRLLLEELDDALVTMAVAESLGIKNEPLRKKLARCREWFMENVEVFVPAEVFIRSAYHAIDKNIKNRDYALAYTAEIYAMAMNALEDIQEINVPGIELPVSPEILAKAATAVIRETDEATDPMKSILAAAGKILNDLKGTSRKLVLFKPEFLEEEPLMAAASTMAPPVQQTEWISVDPDASWKAVTYSNPGLDEIIVHITGCRNMKFVYLVGIKKEIKFLKGSPDEGHAEFTRSEIQKYIDNKEIPVLMLEDKGGEVHLGMLSTEESEENIS